jgi:PAS domain S-box-containing protein
VVSNRNQILPLSPLNLLWALPAFAVGMGSLIRWSTGEPVSLAFLLGTTGIGLIGAAVGVWFVERVEERLLARLEARSSELRSSRDFLLNLLDSFPGAVLVVNRNGRIAYTSPGVEGLLGAGHRQIQGSSAGLIFLDGTLEYQRILDALDAPNGDVRGERSSVLRGDGQVVPVELSARPIADAGDGRPGVLLVVHDISGRLERERLEVGSERLRILGECVAGVAHELNNPLTGVIGYLQLATEEGLPEHLDDTLRKAGREASRMAQTIRTLLGFVRQREPERIPSDLNRLVEQVCEFLEHQLLVNDIKLLVTTRELPLALVDPHLIRQVLLNLLKNSQDAIRETGRGGTIRVRTSRLGEVFRIEVEDDGPGVPDEEAERIFEHFYTTKPSGKGTGLGLPICRRILEAHGGTIALTEPGSRTGVKFILDLPVPSVEQITELEPPPAEAPAHLNILVVDDEKGVREYVAMVLKGEEHTVREAESGLVGLEFFKEECPDLVLLDMKMPDMGGPECLRRMIEIRPDMDGRIVLMSGDRVARDASELFLSKPMTPDEILAVVARAMRVPALS